MPSLEMPSNFTNAWKQRFFKLSRKHRNKTQERNVGGRERESSLCQSEKSEPRPDETDINHEDQPERRCGIRETGGILQANYVQSKTWPLLHSPERADIESAAPGQLNVNAQPPLDPPSTKPRLAKTWNTIRSAGGGSIRTVASGIRKLVCIETNSFRPGPDRNRPCKPPRSNSDLPSLGHQAQEGADSASPLNTCDEKLASKRSRHATFPREAAMEPKSPDFKDLRQYLRQRAATSKEFNDIWEEKALPDLQTKMKDNAVGDYSIAVQFDYDYRQRIVEITTYKALPEDVEPAVRGLVESLFRSVPLSVTVRFLRGRNKRSTGADIDSEEDDLGEWRPPANPDDHEHALLLGDSVDHRGGRSASTLGPAINFGNETRWLVSCHLFKGSAELGDTSGRQEPPNCYLVHPGNLDRLPDKDPEIVARLRGYSGEMCRTQRQARSLEQFARHIPTNEAWVVTDWALCDPHTEEIKLLNRLRYAPTGREFQECSGQIPGLLRSNPSLNIVRSSGRSSGLRWSVVCETPALVKQRGQPPTREWYLEPIEGYPGMIPIDEWNIAGPGMPGDSGAAIIDDESRRLVGIIWGRTDVGEDKKKPRRAYFTHIFDVFDDIFALYPEIGRYPTLIDQTDEPTLDPSTPPPSTRRSYDPSEAFDEDSDGATMVSTARRSRLSGMTKSASYDSMGGSTCGSMESNLLLTSHDVQFVLDGKGPDKLHVFERPLRGVTLGRWKCEVHRRYGCRAW